jgi:hypothetical protein
MMRQNSGKTQGRSPHERRARTHRRACAQPHNAGGKGTSRTRTPNTNDRRDKDHGQHKGTRQSDKGKQISGNRRPAGTRSKRNRQNRQRRPDTSIQLRAKTATSTTRTWPADQSTRGPYFRPPWTVFQSTPGPHFSPPGPYFSPPWTAFQSTLDRISVHPWHPPMTRVRAHTRSKVFPISISISIDRSRA